MVASGKLGAAAAIMRLRFNPLHCGAVVASHAWVADLPPEYGAFQSPSLRGSGRFLEARDIAHATYLGFNPLHCGAVVASVQLAFGNSSEFLFQSPSLRGSGRFRGLL